MASTSLHLTQEKRNALRSEYKPRTHYALLKYPRPKTKPEYQNIYPWLLPDETDPHFVFCTVCECRLSAKRSDLGKHEGSMKHSENATRKGLPPKADLPATRDIKWEYPEDDEVQSTGKATTNGNGNGKEQSDDDNEEEEDNDDDDDDDDGDEEGDGDDNGDGEGDGDGDNDGEDGDGDVDYEPMRKRRASDTYSDNSGGLDFLPLQVNLSELPNAQFHPPTSVMPPRGCITITKVTTPASSATSSTTATTNETISKAIITPIATCNYPSVQRSSYPSYQSYQSQMMMHHHQPPPPPARDSFDLFFDSICCTVKSLPPKLATEGKIRVMELIGELELRAINEREAQQQQQQQQLLQQQQQQETTIQGNNTSTTTAAVTTTATSGLNNGHH